MKQIFLLRAQCWLTLSALLVGARPAKSQTWIQWSSATGGNNHYYALTPYATNWDAAEKLAVSWGGTLATITSSNEQQFINDTFLNGAFEHRPLWIGLMDSPKRGPFSVKAGPVQVIIGSKPKANFKWVTGEPLNYENWRPGQPDNAWPGENYAAINWFYSDSPPRGAKGDWNDAPPDGTTGYGGSTTGPYFGIVERDTDPTLPVRTKTSPLVYLVAVSILIAVIIIWIGFARRRKKGAA